MIVRILSRVAGVTLVALLCAGCAFQWGRADRDATVSSPRDSYVVIGVQPEKASVSLFEGSFVSGSFKQNPLPPASFIGFPEDGYVVTRVSPDTAYAITYVTLYGSGKELLVPPLVPCFGAKTIAFSVPAGQVLYAGDVSYRKVGNGAVPEFKSNFEEAKRFLATHYVNLAPKLTDGGQNLSTVTGVQCARD